MASPTRWTWVWVSSGSWWWAGKPSMLQSIGPQRFGHDWVTELKTDWHTHTYQPPYHHQKGTTVIVFHWLIHLAEMNGVSTKNHAPTITVSMASSYVSRTSWARYWVLFAHLIVLGYRRCSQRPVELISRFIYLKHSIVLWFYKDRSPIKFSSEKYIWIIFKAVEVL